MRVAGVVGGRSDEATHPGGQMLGEAVVGRSATGVTSLPVGVALPKGAAET